MSPRRSVLIVPGHKEKMHAKAAASPADVVVLDLEDGVPLDQKLKARDQIICSVFDQDWTNKSLSVRINGLDTAYGYRDLLELLEAAGDSIDSVVIPKVDSVSDVHFADRLMSGIHLNKGNCLNTALEASIESAKGLENVCDIAKSSPRLKALVFGIADYSASIGARLVSISGHGEQEEEIYPGHRWNFVLSRMVMAARANGLMVIDAPYGNFKDLKGLERSAVTASSLGCSGKWAIHPGQIETLNAVFSPSKEEIERALRVIKAHADAVAAGLGAVAIDGRMVDTATLNLARDMVTLAKQLGMID